VPAELEVGVAGRIGFADALSAPADIKKDASQLRGIHQSLLSLWALAAAMGFRPTGSEASALPIKGLRPAGFPVPPEVDLVHPEKKSASTTSNQFCLNRFSSVFRLTSELSEPLIKEKIAPAELATAPLSATTELGAVGITPTSIGFADRRSHTFVPPTGAREETALPSVVTFPDSHIGFFKKVRLDIVPDHQVGHSLGRAPAKSAILGEANSPVAGPIPSYPLRGQGRKLPDLWLNALALLYRQ